MQDLHRSDLDQLGIVLELYAVNRWYQKNVHTIRRTFKYIYIFSITSRPNTTSNRLTLSMYRLTVSSVTAV